MATQTIPYFPPPSSRAHEVCGPGAFFYACALGQQLNGSVLWIRETWNGEALNPTGLAKFYDPRHFLVAVAQEQKEVLATAEEALRSGAVPLVVMELSKPIGLTEGRRLQLAARDGRATALAIIPEGMGSNAAETRWHCSPIYDPADSTVQCWKIIKNKSGTLGALYVRWDRTSHSIALVPPAGNRPGS